MVQRKPAPALHNSLPSLSGTELQTNDAPTKARLSPGFLSLCADSCDSARDLTRQLESHVTVSRVTRDITPETTPLEKQDREACRTERDRRR